MNVWTRLLIAIGVPLALAAPGDLDPNFNGTGKRVVAFNLLPPIEAGANAVAVQPDGRIVLAIRYEVQGHGSFALLRLNPDGGNDPSFAGGLVVLDLGVQPAEARAVAIQSDGKVVAAGTRAAGAGSEFVVARFNSDGTPDPGFGTDGVATASFGPDSFALALSVAVQKGGKIVAAGAAGEPGNSDFALARFNPGGTPDVTFGAGGKVTTEFGDNELALAVAVQKGGKIVVAGTSHEDFAIARYQKNGSLDRSFSGDGKLTTDFGGVDLAADQARALASLKDGRIVVAGASDAAGHRTIALARYLPNGRLDRAFDGDGKLLSDVSDTSVALGVALQPDGRIVVAGAGVENAMVHFLVARYQKSGRLDPAFSTDGWVTTDFGATSLAMGVAIQPNGNIVAAGSRNGDPNQVAVARYLAR